MTAELSKIIFEHLCQNEFNLNITLEKVELIPIDYEFLKSCINDTKERLKIKLSKYCRTVSVKITFSKNKLLFFYTFQL